MGVLSPIGAAADEDDDTEKFDREEGGVRGEQILEGEQSAGVSARNPRSLSSVWLVRVLLAVVLSAVDCGSFIFRRFEDEGETKVWAEDGVLLEETGTTATPSLFMVEEILTHCCCWWWWRLPLLPPDPLWLMLVVPQTLPSWGVDVALETEGAVQAVVVEVHNPPAMLLLLLVVVVVVVVEILVILLVTVVVVVAGLLLVVVVLTVVVVPVF